MSKKPRIVIPGLLIDGSPLQSPTKSEESYEKDLIRTQKEFQEFNEYLDEISQSVEKLVKEAPDWLNEIEEIKQKQDKVEQSITVTLEEVCDSGHHLDRLQKMQDEANEKINKDLLEIQKQLSELLKTHQASSVKIENIDHSQAQSNQQLDIMLQAIHEYARLIDECSSTIKNFDDIGAPVKYESLDFSPFKKGEHFIFRRTYLSCKSSAYTLYKFINISIGIPEIFSKISWHFITV
ncbi:hypothetical protein G9A89_001225 [Geosiphon pyriformis]|nr:hypothetical protein G9A89_001225 [Geosiphon pyriformis]